MNVAISKICSKCGFVHPIEDFYRHNGKNGGRRNECRFCCNKRSTKHRNENIEVVREYDRGRSNLPHRVQARREYEQQYKKFHPDRYGAVRALNNAVRDGRVDKLDHCEDCGKGGKMHGHHKDYSKPLSVVWLCVPCHAQRHHGTVL